MTVSSSRRPPLVPRWTLSTATPYILLTFVAIFAITLSFRLSPALGVIATFSAFFLMALPGVILDTGQYLQSFLHSWSWRRWQDFMPCGSAALLCFLPCGPGRLLTIVFWDVWGSRFWDS